MLRRIAFVLLTGISLFLGTKAYTLDSDIRVLNINEFNGVNFDDEPATLEPGDSPDAANVVTDEGSIRTRYGSQRVGTSATATPFRYSYRFLDTSGNNWLIRVSTFNITAAKDGTNYTTTIATITAGSKVRGTPHQGNFYIVDGVQDAIIWDGATVTYSTTIPKGNLIASWERRLWIARVIGNGQVLYGSAQDQPTNFTIPSTPVNTDPVQLQLVARGESDITALYPGYRDYLWVWTDDKTFAITGNSRATFDSITIDPDIGCLSQEAVDVHLDKLKFASRRGIEAIENGKVVKQTDNLDSLFDTVPQLNSASYSSILTSQAEFESGVSVPTGTFSTTITPGAVQPSTWTMVDTSTTNFAAGTLSSLDNNSPGTLSLSYNNSGLINDYQFEGTDWDTNLFGSYGFTGYNDGTCSLNPYTGSVMGLIATPGDTTFRNLKADILANDGTTVLQTITITPSTSWVGYLQNMDATYRGRKCKIKFYLDGGGASYLRSRNLFINSGGQFQITARYCTSSPVNGYKVFIDYVANGVSTISSGNIVSQVFDTGFSTPTWGNIDITTSIKSNTLTFETQVATSAIGSWDSLVAVSTVAIQSAKKRFIRYKATVTLADASLGLPEINDVSLFASVTGQYISTYTQIQSGIGSWGTFEPTVQNNGGSWAFDISVATYPAGLGASYTSLTPGAIITASTGTYFWVRATPTLPSPLDRTITVPKLLELKVNWNSSNTPDDPLVLRTFKDRLYVFMSTGTSNNRYTLVHNKNEHWIPYLGWQAASAVVYRNTLYLGNSSSDGYMYTAETPGVYDDAGNPINAYWKTKTFATLDSEDSPDREKEFNFVRVSAKQQGPSDLNLSCFFDDSHDELTLGSVAMGTGILGGAFVNEKIPFPTSSQQIGHMISLKFGTNSTNTPFLLHNLAVYYRLRELE